MRALLALLVLALAGCPHPRAVNHAGGGGKDPTGQPGDAIADVGDRTGEVTGAADSGSDDHRLGDAAPKVHDLDVIHMDVVGHDANGEPIIEASTPGPLLDQGNKAFAAGKLEEAEGWYRKLATEFPDSALAPAALYNLALVIERRGEVDAAATAYAEVYTAYPDAPESLEAMLRAAALRADREEWAKAQALLRTLEARDDLDRVVRIEVEARLGYVLVELDRFDDAELAFGAAIKAWQRMGSKLEDPYYVAMAHFYLGEIDARRFERQVVRSADDELKADMSQKRAHLMAAYDHWKAALEWKQAYWATAAGYQMSQIFFEYWKAAVRAPFPDGLSVDARPQYVAEVHDRLRVNLEKALDGHKASVELAEVFGVATAWTEGSKQRAVEIMAILDREARGEHVVP
jgi:tetratricopeptide (TPR) repeat protein